jgi:hypothetical protein
MILENVLVIMVMLVAAFSPIFVPLRWQQIGRAVNSFREHTTGQLGEERRLVQVGQAGTGTLVSNLVRASASSSRHFFSLLLFLPSLPSQNRQYLPAINPSHTPIPQSRRMYRQSPRPYNPNQLTSPSLFFTLLLQSATPRSPAKPRYPPPKITMRPRTPARFSAKPTL